MAKKMQLIETDHNEYIHKMLYSYYEYSYYVHIQEIRGKIARF